MPTLTCMLTTALTLFALAVATWSLYAMTRQLTVARSASGGRAMVFTAGITGRPESPPVSRSPTQAVSDDSH